MYAKVNTPLNLQPEELDDYLAKGWFRMGQSIFTTNFLNFKNQFYSAIWLRIDLRSYSADSTFKKLSKLNSDFRIEFNKCNIDLEKEELFALYRSSVAFDASDSIQQQLLGSSNIESIFDTREICLYDGEKLIAAGFFDIGKNAAEGISSFYHPEYKKYSLGKFLIYSKIEYCKSLGLEYFYPGYFVPGYEAFDYKLSIGNKELYFYSYVQNEWIPISEFSKEYDLFPEIYNRLKLLESELEKHNFQTKLYNYEYFQANMVHELSRYDLFDHPIFLFCVNLGNPVIKPIIVYNVSEHQYQLLECRSVWETFETVDKTDSFSAHLLKTNQVYFSTPDVNIMVQNLIK
ncbi:MAG: arginyl-tRNA--protein arginylyltransferase [Opitutaceae bacterium]|nr:arginyl-tRNA--protein arginylyltransferase [Cytophagales bacterium]